MMHQNKKGISLIEVVVSIFIVGLILVIFSASFTSVRANRVNKHRSIAYQFAQTEMEALRRYPFDQLTNRTDAGFIGLAYNYGAQKITNDASALSGTQVIAVNPGPDLLSNNLSSGVFLPESYYDDFTFRAHVKVLSQSSLGWRTGIVFRYGDIENYYLLSFDTNSLDLLKVEEGVQTTLYTEPNNFQENVWYSLKVVTSADSISIYLNEVPVNTVTDSTFSTGSLGIVGRWTTYHHIDDIYVQSAVQTNTWNFDSQVIDEFPNGMLQIAPTEVRDLLGTITISDYLGLASIKQLTVRVDWTERDTSKSVQLTTLRGP